MGETRVDLLHLIEDLRDAYPGSLEETIVTEVVANSLDSGATMVELATDTASATLTVVDDGSGMKPRELTLYHDIAATTKRRGEGIGFAGVVPGLAECLTLNKADFVRSGPRGMTYLAYRKAIQEAVAAQLAAWGEARDAAEEARRRRAQPLERDLATVLVDLAEDFPLLASLVERHAGGQRRLALGGTGQGAVPALEPVIVAEASAGALVESPVEPSEAPGAAPPEGAASREPPAGRAPGSGADGLTLPGGRGPKRPGRYGLTIRFEARPDDPELGRLVESTVWVNEAHPAYRRAAASRSEGYHLALTVAMALAPLAVEPPHAHRFITAFLARWGAAVDRPSARHSRRR